MRSLFLFISILIVRLDVSFFVGPKPNGLRHTHVYPIYNKVNINYLSERLGHSDIKTNFKYYSHVIKELREDEKKQRFPLLNTGGDGSGGLIITNKNRQNLPHGIYREGFEDIRAFPLEQEITTNTKDLIQVLIDFFTYNHISNRHELIIQGGDDLLDGS
jgi:hypothetical protein